MSATESRSFSSPPCIGTDYRKSHRAARCAGCTCTYLHSELRCAHTIAEVLYETQLLAFGFNHFSGLPAAACATRQTSNSGGNAGRPGAASNLQRTGCPEKAGHVRRFPAKVRRQSGSGGLWQLADLAISARRRRSAKSSGLRRQGAGGFSPESGYSGVTGQYRPTHEE